MKRDLAVGLWILLLTFGLLLCGLPLSAQTVQRNAFVIHEIKHDTSLPLRELARNAPATEPQGQRTLFPVRATHFTGTTSAVDPVVQTEVLPLVSASTILNFDGVGGTAAGGVFPPDTNGSVGGSQFVLITNFDYEVFDKATGAIDLGPARINTVWSGFGGQCQTNNGGDPIALWDKLAQRWVLEQLEYFVSGQNLVCVAVSTTSDATGSYNRYSFNFGSSLPDYPKIGVWPDAYYLSVNSFGAGFAEPCALNRTAMLSGQTATMVCFSPNSQNFSFLPSDMDGVTQPPAGAPAHFIQIGNGTTTLNYWDFHVDFVNTANSTFTGPNTITVPSYSLACGGFGSCEPQPSPGEKLDSLGDRLMYRNAYRNFGDHETMLVSHSVKPGSGATSQGAARWYEFRATPPGSTFTLFQSGTFQNKTMSIWMSSVAMDKNGDIALGASASSSSLKPAILYTGRVPTDTLGKLESAKVIAKGTGVQTGGGSRWGDYSSMSIDPADDCTFWYAQEYYLANGTNWISHVASFKFDSCN